MNCEYEKEQKLITHYDNNPNYYSTKIDEILQKLGYDIDKLKVSRILDVGCGDGRACFKLAETGAEIVGVDYSKVRIDKANKENKYDNVTFVYDDVHHYIKNCDKFDLVIANEVIEHVQDPYVFVDNLKKISDWIVGTVPINMPYVAHLTVWETMKDIQDSFEDFRVAKMGMHSLLEWKNPGSES